MRHVSLRQLAPLTTKATAVALLVLAIFLACAATYRVFNESTPNPGPSSELTIDQACLDFGEVWENPEFKWDLLIHNQGAKVAEILSFTSSCACVSVKPASLIVPPGE